jgi:hypothetical protein
VPDDFDPVAHNRAAWDREVEAGNEWTRPVGPEVIARAREGDWSVVLIGYEPVPRDWFPARLDGARVLCLASGGGQQGPVLAAAGAQVTVFDNAPRQLARDQEVAARDGLVLQTVLGDIAWLHRHPRGQAGRAPVAGQVPASPEAQHELRGRLIPCGDGLSLRDEVITSASRSFAVRRVIDGGHDRSPSVSH